MNTLRHNFVTILLTVVVVAVTALNHYSTQCNLVEFHSNNADICAEVALSEAKRADQVAAAYRELAKTTIQLQQENTQLKACLQAVAEELSQEPTPALPPQKTDKST